MTVIDAHVHVWDLQAATYPWLTHDLAPLDRTYTLEQAEPDMATCGVERVVLVQAADDPADTAHMLRVADEHPLVAGIVGWLPLEQPDRTANILERWALERRLVGVRHLIHREADPDWLLRPDVLESLALVAEHSLTFDVCAERLELLAHVPTLAERLPTLTLIVDHLAKPPIRERGWRPWCDLLAAAASAPNVAAKVSGLNTAADISSWTTADLQPYVDHAVAQFGPDRLMCGGDWPFALLGASSYRHVWTATAATIAGLAATERAAILGGTAARIYHLDT